VAEQDFLLSLGAYSGVPAVLSYQMLVVRGFGGSEALLNVERLTLRSERDAKLISDPSKGLGNSTIDKLKGAFAHQGEGFNLKVGVQYNAKDLGYLDEGGEVYPNDRSLAGLSLDWEQRLSDDAQSSLNIDLSSLRMGGPLSSGHENGLDLKTDFGVRSLWSRSHPIDAGLGVRYFAGEDSSEEFKEAYLRLYFKDNDIRVWPFVLGTGIEFIFGACKSSSEGEDWDPLVYLNPCVLLTSQIGSRTMLQFGLEGYVLRQAFTDLYLDTDYVRFNPGLNAERTWELNISLQHRVMRTFVVDIGAFGKEIRDLTVFEETSDGILSWMPFSWDSARIFGFNSGWDLSLIGGRVKQSFEYIHEFHDQKEFIPYRPRDRGRLTITYFAPFGLEPSLSGEFYGTRYVDASGKETLSGYFLWKPRISKTFGKYASVFLAAEFYAGRDEYQVWEGYKLPSQIVDFGLTLKF
jgi:hypothetical protein